MGVAEVRADKAFSTPPCTEEGPYMIYVSLCGLHLLYMGSRTAAQMHICIFIGKSFLSRQSCLTWAGTKCKCYLGVLGQDTCVPSVGVT